MEMDSPAMKERLAVFEDINNSMTSAMDDGSLAEWAAQHVAEDVQFVLAPDLDDPSEDSVVYGRDLWMQHYNDTIITRYPKGSWTIQQQMYLLSETAFNIDLTLVIETDDGPHTDSLRIIQTMNSENQISLFVKCPLTSDQIMGPALLWERGMMPRCPPAYDELRRPCRHNSWDSIRGKQTLTVLRCRVCDVLWKIPAALSHAHRCCDFRTDSCPFTGGTCRRIHIHARKVRQCDRDVPLLPAEAEPRRRKPRPGKNARMRLRKMRCGGGGGEEAEEARPADLGRVVCAYNDDDDEFGARVAKLAGPVGSIIDDVSFNPASWLFSRDGMRPAKRL
ncbi:hypothetical protein DIPPA_34803 [Diplonema papillatum]|nr:hypothetical protein DIPPA_34803 [Diplonema papillatum]|eukprot:gene4822-7442_t